MPSYLDKTMSTPNNQTEEDLNGLSREELLQLVQTQRSQQQHQPSDDLAQDANQQNGTPQPMMCLELETEEHDDDDEEGPLMGVEHAPRSRNIPLSFNFRDAQLSVSKLKDHKVKFLLGLGVIALLFLAVQMKYDTESTSQLDQASTRQKQPTLHTSSSFGGINNVAHPGGAKAAAQGQGIAFADIIIPKSNVGHAINSLNRANILNLWGHYVHDEHRSPYASHLYNQSKAFLEEQQDKFLKKMEKVRSDWGAWNFEDPAGKIGRTATLFNAPYKDVPREEFAPDAWQHDEEYLGLFWKEARGLVGRMREGIYAEYGSPLKKKDGTTLTKEEQAAREEAWKIHVYKTPEEATELPNIGLAKLSQAAYDGLVRKLLHAMISHDDFYVVLGGHSAAAGHGNQFQQNRVITFHSIMEPVFDKLGMRLVSRNMGMGGVGTLQFSMAGGDMYGEADILEWDSGMTEKGSPVDMFNKQAILSGERVPIIISDYHFNVVEETNNTAMMGKYINDVAMIPETTLENQDSMPWAARWLNGKMEKYNAICWEPRTDYMPAMIQAAHPGSQVGWHPGNRNHQWQGRKLAMIVLKGLDAAFDLWEKGIQEEGCPLPESYWHIGDHYKFIRKQLRTHVTTPKSDQAEEDVRSDCEKMMPFLPRICRVQMHGFGMWYPRAHIDYDLLNIIKPAPNGYKPHFNPDLKNAYDGFDLLPLNQAVPEGEVDVHAIAIATRETAPDLDHSWSEDNNPGGPPARRWLRQATESAFRSASETRMGSQRALAPNADTKDKSRQNAKAQSSAGNNVRRQLKSNSTGIIPGRGWELHKRTTIKGFCDGSAQSECNREAGSTCLMLGHNDRHNDVHGNSLSGWLVFDVPKVKEGIVLIRMEWWCGGKTGETANLLTTDWTEVNDGKTEDTTPWNQTTRRATAAKALMEDPPRERFLGKPTPEETVPKDFEMDIAINGKITTMKYEEWMNYKKEYSKNCAVWPLLNDESMAQKDWEGEPMEVAVRFRSKLKPKQTFCISHVYYA